MKRATLICGLIFPALVGLSQPYDTLQVGYHTSVNLIFASPVLKWDMGLGVIVAGWLADLRLDLGAQQTA